MVCMLLRNIEDVDGYTNLMYPILTGFKVLIPVPRGALRHHASFATSVYFFDCFPYSSFVIFLESKIIYI
jgi:hypothetical protein